MFLPRAVLIYHPMIVPGAARTWDGAMSPSKLTVEAWPVTDRGQADENQDTVLIYEPANSNQIRFSGNLYVVADGLGSSERGKLASEYVARRVMHYYYTHDE